MGQETTKGIAPVWCDVRTVAVRIGGKTGRICGYLWTDDGAEYHFAYLPIYCCDPDAVPLDPFNLPLGFGVRSAKGLNGPLGVFGACLGGGFSERVAYKVFASRMSGIKPNSPEINKVLPQNDLTKLVWGSWSNTHPWGINGKWFDPSAPWPKTDLIWMPPREDRNQDIQFWSAQKSCLPNVRGQAPGNFESICNSLISGGAVEPYSMATLAYALPMPGNSLRLRFDFKVPKTGKLEPGLLRFVDAGHGVRVLRVRTAYLRLAAACGINALPPLMKGRNEDGRDFVWTRLLVGGPWTTFKTPPKHKSTPYPENPELNPDNWLVETLDTGAYLGKVPWHGYIQLANLMRRNGALFDYEEAYRRVVFCILCGTMCMDDTPILYKPMRVEPSWRGDFVGEPIRYRLAPLQILKPWLLPYKTAYVMRPRLVVHAARYARVMGLTRDQGEVEVTRVITGLMRWQSIFEEVGITEYELGGIRPAIFANRPNSGDVTRKPNDIRKAKIARKATADAEAAQT